MRRILGSILLTLAVVSLADIARGPNPIEEARHATGLDPAPAAQADLASARR